MDSFNTVNIIPTSNFCVSMEDFVGFQLEIIGIYKNN